MMPIANFPIPMKMDDREGHNLPPDAGTNMLSVRMGRERVERGPGSATYGSVSGSINGTAYGFGQSYLGVNSVLLLITTTKVYRVAANLWSDIHTFAVSLVGLPVVAATLDEMFITTGNNHAYHYDGTTFASLNDAGYKPASVATNFGAIGVIPFNNRFVMIATIEDSDVNRTRIRWHVNGDVTDWDGVGSGFLEVIENNLDPLIHGAVLGDRAYLFKQRQILELIATGDADTVFRTESRVHGTGMLARHSWAATENFGFFLGPDDVYMWDGTTLRSIGGPIYKTLMRGINFHSPAYPPAENIQGTILTQDSEYWLLFPDLTPNTYIYDYRRDRWYTDHFVGATALSTVRQGSALFTNSPGDVDASEFVVLGRSADLPLYVSPLLTLKDGSVFLSEVITRDFPSQAFDNPPGRYGLASGGAIDRINNLWEMQFRGAPFTTYLVAVSVDQGVEWLEEQNVSCDVKGIGRAFFNTAFGEVRFRFRSQALVDGVATTHSNAFTLKQTMALRWTEGGTQYV